MSDITHIGQLTPDPENARRHTPRNVGMIEDALGEVGAARSIVIDENGVILAGNATIEAAALAGIERVQVVEADGETIVAVRRSGLTAEQKKRLALYDNRASELATWDVEQLLADVEAGVDFDGLFYEDELSELLAFDDGHEEYEEHQDDDFWPYIHIQVSPEVFQQWQTLFENIDGDTNSAKIESIMDVLNETLPGCM